MTRGLLLAFGFLDFRDNCTSTLKCFSAVFDASFHTAPGSPHRVATAFLAISRRRSGVSFRARALPPIEATCLFIRSLLRLIGHLTHGKESCDWHVVLPQRLLRRRQNKSSTQVRDCKRNARLHHVDRFHRRLLFWGHHYLDFFRVLGTCDPFTNCSQKVFDRFPSSSRFNSLSNRKELS